MKTGYNDNELATVKGLRGLRHGTLNLWVDRGEDRGNKLVTLCGKGISPNYRSLTISSINCPKCKELVHDANFAKGIMVIEGAQPVDPPSRLATVPF